jgi:hypothetical protein
VIIDIFLASEAVPNSDTFCPIILGARHLLDAIAPLMYDTLLNQYLDEWEREISPEFGMLVETYWCWMRVSIFL